MTERAEGVTISSSYAGACAVEPPETAPESPAWLQERCAFWQRQLRLQDWDIATEWADCKALDGACGRTAFHHTTKEARIRILRETEFPPESERTGGYDCEQFLVHELLHLHLKDWEDDAGGEKTPGYRSKELAIDLIAWALVRLERGERR